MIEAIAAQIAIKFGSIHIRKPCAGANFAHNGIERAHRRAARDPMALVIIVAIGPQIAVPRKGWIGTRIPSPDMGPRHIQHAPIIFDRLRVVLWIVPIAVNHPQILHLDQLIAPPFGIARQGAFRAFWIKNSLSWRQHQLKNRPDQSIHPIRTARAAIALMGHPAHLIFKLLETQRMCHPPLLIQSRHRFGPNGFTAGRMHTRERNERIEGRNDRLDHISALIDLSHQAISVKFLHSRNRSARPIVGRLRFK